MKRRFVTFSMFLLCLGALPAFADNIVTNGTFTGTSGWTTTQTNGDYPWGWGSGYARTGCVGAQCISGSPGQLADLNQILPTVAGNTYTLSFAYNSAGYPYNELEVLFGGNVVADLVNAPGSLLNYTFNGLVATSNSTELTFLGRQDPSFDYLTDVSVSTSSTGVTPEPSSLLLLGSGLLGMAGLTMRKVLA